MWCEGGRCVFFFNDTATTEIYTLSLHDALPILPDDDLAGLDDLAAEALHAEALGVRVATVAGRRCALLVCQDRKSTRLNSSHANISYAVFCLKKKKNLIPLSL